MIVMAFLAASASMPLVVPSTPDLVFACAHDGDAKPITIGLPTGLSRSEVLVSDPTHVLGRYTLTTYAWKIGQDGRLSVAFYSSNGDPKQPIFVVQQGETGKGTDYLALSHPFAQPNKISRYACQLMHGEAAAKTIQLIRAQAE